MISATSGAKRGRTWSPSPGEAPVPAPERTCHVPLAPPRLLGCLVYKEQICGVDGFQASHPSSQEASQSSHHTLGGLALSKSILEAVQGSARGGLPDPPLNFAPSALFPSFLLIQKKQHATGAAPSLRVPPCGLAGGAPGPSGGDLTVMSGPCAPQPRPCLLPWAPRGEGSLGGRAGPTWAQGRGRPSPPEACFLTCELCAGL